MVTTIHDSNEKPFDPDDRYNKICSTCAHISKGGQQPCIDCTETDNKWKPVPPPLPTKHFKGEGGAHYKQDRIVETYLLMEQVAQNVHAKTSDIKKALWAAMAMKHLDRVGTKDDVDGELLKAENYLHRARTGEWVKK